ncbi:MAG: 5'/3'-nucleotidase SurE [Bacillota bacterium]|nr:5'/3'-nucleotidase SurE [Bacillota bacterium]
MTVKNILITNDDGINSRGIRAMVDALSQVADIYVCAPDGQRSAFSHGITTGESIHIEEVPYDNATMAFQTSGTPADCVKIGVRLLRARGINIDMVYSGINQGSNLGTDTLYSGTVGAAMEGNVCGVPAVAVSVGSHEAENFEYAKRLAVDTFNAAADKIPANMVLNINVPDIPEEEIAGVKYTVLGDREYDELFPAEDAAKSELDYKYSGVPLIYSDLPDTLDVVAAQKGYATITPLQRDLTYYGKVEEIKNWGIDD